MPPKLREFLQRWLIGTLAVLVATYILPGIHYRHWPDLLVATFILGILNTFVRPLLMFLSLPLLLFTLGLFTLVINALLLLLVSWLMGDAFYVDDFWTALWGAVIIALTTLTLNSLTGTGRTRIEVRRKQKASSGRSDHDDDDGPVIDV